METYALETYTSVPHCVGNFRAGGRPALTQRSSLIDSLVLVNIHELEPGGLKALLDHVRKSS